MDWIIAGLLLRWLLDWADNRLKQRIKSKQHPE
jgi:hypothetical protein